MKAVYILEVTKDIIVLLSKQNIPPSYMTFECYRLFDWVIKTTCNHKRISKNIILKRTLREALKIGYIEPEIVINIYNDIYNEFLKLIPDSEILYSNF